MSQAVVFEFRFYSRGTSYETLTENEAFVPRLGEIVEHEDREFQVLVVKSRTKYTGGGDISLYSIKVICEEIFGDRY